MKNLCFFGGVFFKIKIADILNFQWIKYLGKGLSYLKNWGIGVYYCWNYGPRKLLLRFIEYPLDRLNNKQTKIAGNSAIQYFEGRFQRKYLLKVWSFLVHLPQNVVDGPKKCKIFAKLNGNHLLMANIFKLHKYETFGLIKMHNMSKIRYTNNKFNLLRWNKRHFSLFSKDFQLPKIASDLRLCL